MSEYKEAIKRMREVGKDNTRVVATGNTSKIEIKVGNNWVALLRDLKPTLAEDIVRQAINRIILG